MRKFIYVSLFSLMACAMVVMVSCSKEAVTPSSNLKGVANCGEWQLQTPDCAQKGACGVSNSYYYTSGSDQVFVAPRSGCTTPNSSNTRTELRGNTWSLGGNHALYATCKVVTALGSICVGQIHYDGGSTKPLCELYMYPDGSLHLQVEAGPSGGQISGSPFNLGSVGIGNYFSYEIKLSGSSSLQVQINGSWHTYTVNTGGQAQYFKAGCYNQTSGSGSDKVQFSNISTKTF
jgi:hypothetical protein